MAKNYWVTSRAEDSSLEREGSSDDRGTKVRPVTVNDQLESHFIIRTILVTEAMTESHRSRSLKRGISRLDSRRVSLCAPWLRSARFSTRYDPHAPTLLFCYTFDFPWVYKASSCIEYSSSWGYPAKKKKDDILESRDTREREREKLGDINSIASEKKEERETAEEESSMTSELQLPPGFRFHPTDEELVNHYLCRKCASLPLAVPIIREIDLYKFDPWQLPGNLNFQFLCFWFLFEKKNFLFFSIFFFEEQKRKFCKILIF